MHTISSSIWYWYITVLLSSYISVSSIMGIRYFPLFSIFISIFKIVCKMGLPWYFHTHVSLYVSCSFSSSMFCYHFFSFFPHPPHFCEQCPVGFHPLATWTYLNIDSVCEAKTYNALFLSSPCIFNHVLTTPIGEHLLRSFFNFWHFK